ncbi:hypothetical protein SAMN02745248_02407 [Hathewaya proteolytica DSM 3090]|uniref:Uncharacterized protein n=1 Tax=Hathewaya proteolytica DSM 3090 TaxID=1121331 RepID=A0A1M6S0F5_9CLOT|nr:hypothetical protein [Hathewaya proteolytica]SHK38049.1 hypothetical protein SAMN02745248_02407 [Hathewaya proteolytica DSM 3090]
MKFPCLVPKKFCKTPIQIKIYQDGLSEDGGPLEALSISTLCNYQDKAKKVLTAEQQLIQIEGTALIPGDIASSLPTLSNGTVIVNGVNRNIYRGEKARNPDGTVNYTRLELV